MREHSLGESPEHIGLILPAVGAVADAISAIFGFGKLGIMACRDGVKAVFEGKIKEAIELYSTVTYNTRIRGSAVAIFVDKIGDNLALEAFSTINYI